MGQTVVGVFDRYAAAQRAAESLRARGFDDDDIEVTAGSTDDANLTSSAASSHEEPGLLERIKNFFTGVDDDDVEAYSEHVRRGGAVLKVEVEHDSEIDMVRDAMVAEGALDIDERVSEWRAGGWMASTAASRGAATSMPAQADRDAEAVIPVVQEDLEIGKRTVRAGGVRVYARVVERPVHESVELREERARVERRDVDRPATEADLASMGERSFVVEETAERPVVQKTARVIEEVVVGKEVRHTTADIDDTVRHTEIDVQDLGGDETGTGGAYATAGVGEAGWRSDFATRFGGSRRWEDVEPAYRYGHTLASDNRYRGRDWDTFESEARSGWTSSHPGSTWDEVKAAVRHAWERAKA